jgi:hypothetical protein
MAVMEKLLSLAEEASAVWSWLIAHEKSGTGSSSQNEISDFVLQLSVRNSKPVFQ